VAAPIAPDPGPVATPLGISQAALEMYRSSEVVDLHVDSYIWTRILGYDLAKRHGRGLLGGRFYSQVDLPRIREAGIGGAMWSITTYPWRTASARGRALEHNLARLRSFFDAHPDTTIVRSEAEYRAARAQGQHAVMLAVQGGDALESEPISLAREPLLRVTLIHMTGSAFGCSSAPLSRGPDTGLSKRGHGLVERLNARRIFVDLAHISRQGFRDVLQVHDASQPLIVTHTGVAGVHPSWRNVDDEQLRQIADTGGVVGVIFHGDYLCGRYLSGGTLAAVAEHLAHIVRVAGEDVAALGSDWDGAIVPPPELRSCTGLPKLVDALLRRGLGEEVIRKILGENFLRALRQLRP